MSAVVLDCDVVVVGLGPSGLMVAAHLARRGVRVIAIERHEALYGLPRAGHVDHEIVRFLQEVGVEDKFLADAYPIQSYHWYNGQGQRLLEMNWGGVSDSGCNTDYMMYQPVLEDALVTALDRAKLPPRQLRGHQVNEVTQDADGVTVKAQRTRPDGKGGFTLGDEIVTVRGKWLLAADGARSSIRERLGIERHDLGFNEPALVVDARVKRPLPLNDPFHVCDPKRPAFIGPLGKRHHRFELHILPGEDPAEFSRPEKAWELLAKQNIGPDDVEIVRQLVYVFEARVAKQWRDNRILLLGDAAHTMPPFMGQGACSGMRDSVNVAWKLEMVLRGIAPDTLLDSYQTEREPHTRTWIDISIQTGEVLCTRDLEQAAKRDALLLSGQAPPVPEFPGLTSGILDFGPKGERVAPVGSLFPQRAIVRDGQSGFFDDIAGRGFLVVTVDPEVAAKVGQPAREFLQRIDRGVVTISRTPAPGALVDLDGFYADWFAKHGVVAVIVRPDYYVYGVARNADAVDALVARLQAALTGVAPEASRG
ncbi:bifunctional 3-(3-hydroxy-phenyl)propionate/3-hydroxycinnamic acid hydroxylase [Pendulispora rubella]|uniref:Bifunctional 3-(3-hydroxy-phenyl)propionate/3-hydroxycinnamic acid hydroxylase n=1 Tax=Pendulispora rubella TaxID=2741070 RepID=A0ABZ2KYN5_9BACT